MKLYKALYEKAITELSFKQADAEDPAAAAAFETAIRLLESLDEKATDWKTAFNLCGDDDWIDAGFRVRIKGGSTTYESARYIEARDRVALERLDTTQDHRFKYTVRYVDPDTAIELVEP